MTETLKMNESKQVVCPWCHKFLPLTPDGNIASHREEGDTYECLGSRCRPPEAARIAEAET